MVELLQPTPDHTICDPICGTAGFLVSVAHYIREHYEDTMTEAKWAHFARDCFTGFDTDHTMLCISVTNLIFYSISHPDIFYQDSGSKKKQISERYTL